jgi:hypothetical protein
LLIALAPTNFHRNRVRTGFYHIARQTRSRIVVLGFDFLAMRGYVSERHWDPPTDASYELGFQTTKYEAEMLDELNHIYPLNPEQQTRFSTQRYFELYPERKNLPEPDIGRVNVRGVSKVVSMYIWIVAAVVLLMVVLVFQAGKMGVRVGQYLHASFY